jgi:hypothetical protein
MQARGGLPVDAELRSWGDPRGSRTRGVVNVEQRVALLSWAWCHVVSGHAGVGTAIRRLTARLTAQLTSALATVRLGRE